MVASYRHIVSIEKVHDQQFYGMSVADHHNLVAGGIVLVWGISQIFPKPCCKCGKPGNVTRDGPFFERSKWWCFDHMHEFE